MPKWSEVENLNLDIIFPLVVPSKFGMIGINKDVSFSNGRSNHLGYPLLSCILSSSELVTLPLGRCSLALNGKKASLGWDVWKCSVV